MNLIEVAARLRDRVPALRFGAPVACVYNPLDYAWALHRAYLETYGSGPKRVVLLGMNPGPWGMVQTGVPFGDLPMVRDWMGLSGEVGRPRDEHPKRPILGLGCHRREVSGSRLWGWARDRFGSPEAFFEHFFVLNYCPLAFLEAGGANRTPDKLPRAESAPLFALCDAALADAVAILGPGHVLGIGRFAAARAEAALAGRGLVIGTAPHPSPANPAANRGWAPLMDRALAELGVELD